MAVWKNLVLVFTGLLCLVLVAGTNSTADDLDVYYPFLEWSDVFDWKLLKAFGSPQHRNVIISPIGLKLILALLYEGSAGYTEKEFQSVLQFNTDKQQHRETYKEIIEALQPSERKQYLLNLGTRVFLDNALTPKQKFSARALSYYRTDIEPTNFTNTQAASLSVNTWIDKLTNGKVNHLVSPGDLQDAVMVIANAIYFKGTWRHQFPKNLSTESGFYVSPRQVVTVPYMTTIDNFYYVEAADLDAKILRLPYKGGNYALFIVLPNAKSGLNELIQRINLQALKRQLILMSRELVQVTLPKFKFNFQARFTDTLKQFELKQIFENSASFPEIAFGASSLLRMLVVSDIIQKAGIEVDEEGSVVYAASDVQVGNKFGEVDYVFNATHPFLFFLEEQSKGTVLFVGKVENPLDNRKVELPQRFGETQGVQPDTLSVPDLQPENPEKEAILRRFNYFDLELLKEFSESNRNILISPASIKTTLALLLEGAKGQTAQEIGNALRIQDIRQPVIRQVLSKLLMDLNDKGPNTDLESGNGIFVSMAQKIQRDYQRVAMQNYKALVKDVDFTAPNRAAQYINLWVYNTTRGLIDQIISPNNLYEDTELVLANALYFKGKWKTAFEFENTKDKCFYTPTRGCVKVPLMVVSETFNYNFAADLNAHAVELPYLDDKYAMLLLIPSDGNNVRTLANDMQHAQLHTIVESLKPNELILEMPRFEIDYSVDLSRSLQAMKIQDVFGPTANLSGIIAGSNARVNSIIHKAKIDVNEEGTKAAAATGAIVIPLMGTTTQKVTADRPFIFFIYHQKSKNIIFEGIYVDPPISEKSFTKSYPNSYRQLGF